MEQLKETFMAWIGAEITRFDGKVGPRFRHPSKYGNADLPKCKDTFININEQNWKKVWVWSDLHFGHKNIIKYSKRPFTDTDAMETELLAAFNSIVGPDDISIWVGDIAFQADSRTNEQLALMNGYKILIIGNHDFNHKKLRNLDFDETHLVYSASDEKVDLAFTHFPLGNLDKSIINVHGHQHVGEEHWTDNSQQHINVNCEFHEFKPVSLDQIAKWARIGRISMGL